jgi:hypothetical protein
MAVRVTLILAIVLLAAPGGAQNFAPSPPPAPPRASLPMATICSTDAGWCPLRTVVAPGGPCYCHVPPSTWLPGVARSFRYEGPVSPYLNPHTAPPSTLR